MSLDADSNWVLEKSACAAVSVYEYQHGKMYISLFCQAENGDLYELKGLYRSGTAMIIDNPTWEATATSLCGGADAPNPETSLATVVHYDGPGIPTVRLFYIDQSDYIREVVWTNGEEVEKARLPAKAAGNSNLSAVQWKAGGKTQLRVYYQSASGAIEECSKEGTGSWTKGATLDFSRRDSDATPISGTSLSFISLPDNPPQLRGYWQASNTAIREATYDGRSWSLSSWVEAPCLSGTAIAAAWAGERKNPDILIYRLGEDGELLQTKRNSSVTEPISSAGVDPGTKLAVVNADNGFEVFTSDGNNVLRRVAEKDLKSNFKNPKALKIAKNSPLKLGVKPPAKVWR